MQHIDGLGKAQGVNGPERIAVVVIDDFQYAGVDGN